MNEALLASSAAPAPSLFSLDSDPVTLELRSSSRSLMSAWARKDIGGRSMLVSCSGTESDFESSSFLAASLAKFAVEGGAVVLGLTALCIRPQR